MRHAGDVRHLAVIGALLLGAAACGVSEGALPNATPVSFDEVVAVTTSQAVPTSGDVDTSSTAEPATSSTAASTSVESVSTVSPPSTDWVNATLGLVGLPSECGNLSLVSSRPDQDMLIASIARQGLWASRDGVDSWSRLGTAASSAKIANRGSAIVFDPANPDTFWESGTYNGGGVYRTDDGGSRFRQLGNLEHVDAVSVDFAGARKTLVATVQSSIHTYRSSDGGDTWFDLTSFLPLDIGITTAPVVIDERTFLLGTSTGKSSAVLRSIDAGVTWSTVYDAGVVGKPLRANFDGALYWQLERINGIIVSHDDGQSWALIPPKTEILPTLATLVELHDGSLASISNDRVVVSPDQGASWVPIGPPLPITPSGIVYSAYRKAFYVWHFDCDLATDDPILANSIMRLDFDPVAG
jgi:photosystem II stability/assembly factor-like uncharacterized protein